MIVGGQMCGGTGPENQANEEVQAIIDHLANEIRSNTGKNYETLTAVSFKSQVVAGTNYFIKVRTSEGEHLHVRAFKPLPFQGDVPQLHGLQSSKSHEDSIEYF